MNQPFLSNTQPLLNILLHFPTQISQQVLNGYSQNFVFYVDYYKYTNIPISTLNGTAVNFHLKVD